MGFMCSVQSKKVLLQYLKAFDFYNTLFLRNNSTKEGKSNKIVSDASSDESDDDERVSLVPPKTQRY